MFTIRLFFAGLTLLTAAMTTVVAVAPQPASAGTAACMELPHPVRA
jgi:hypothetical protein